MKPGLKSKAPAPNKPTHIYRRLEMAYKQSPWGKEREDTEQNLAHQLLEPGASKASIIHGKYGQCGMIVFWEDGHTTVCMGTDSPVSSEAEKGSAYTTSKPEGEKAYHIARAHYAGMGFELTEIHA
jgi:hypothetical protein